MSDPLEQEFDEFRPRRTAGRGSCCSSVLGVIVAFFLVTLFASIYTDRLWYSSVGYSGVYDTMLWTRVGLFFGFGLLMAARSREHGDRLPRAAVPAGPTRRSRPVWTATATRSRRSAPCCWCRWPR